MVFLVACSPVVIYALYKVHSNTTDMQQWLPQGREEVRQYERFVEMFGVDDFVVVSWPDCTLSDPRLGRFSEALRSHPADSALWQSVVTGPEVLREMMRGEAKLPPALAAKRLREILLGRGRAYDLRANWIVRYRSK